MSCRDECAENSFYQYRPRCPAAHPIRANDHVPLHALSCLRDDPGPRALRVFPLLDDLLPEADLHPEGERVFVQDRVHLRTVAVVRARSEFELGQGLGVDEGAEVGVELL